MNKIPMTADGYNRLREELRGLKTIDRPAIIRAVAEARTAGDMAESPEYHAARDRQSFIESRVMELEDKIARAEVIDVSKLSGSVVKFGAKVTLADEETDEEQTFQIVGGSRYKGGPTVSHLAIGACFDRQRQRRECRGHNPAWPEILRDPHRRIRLRAGLI